jgi:Flp pilus assembly pilin Flp
MFKAKNFLTRFFSERRGTTSVEYALLLALITGALIASVIALSTAVSGEIDRAATCVESDDPDTDCS